MSGRSRFTGRWFASVFSTRSWSLCSATVRSRPHSSSLGEEAAILGAAATLREADWLFGSSREFGAALWRGMPLDAYVAQVFGNAKDRMKGHPAPDHPSCRAANVASVSSVVGAQITHAVGLAWAAKLSKKDVVALAYFGEGATSGGDFHNGMNFAGVLKAPVVLLCRNNGWATSTPASKQTACASFAGKGVAYGVPGVRVDGGDLFAVLKATRDAVARAASGGGPTLVEAVTVAGRADPIARTRAWLDAKGLFSDAKHAELVEKLEREIDVAIAAAERVAPPSRESLFDDVYAGGSDAAALPWHLREQRELLLATPPRTLPKPSTEE